MIQPQQTYGDKTVVINNIFIKLYKYYFPLATSKTIFFQEIDHIIYHPKQIVDVIWGFSNSHLNNWFPFDQHRKYKEGYFQIVLKNNSLRPCFSPIQPQKAFKVIWDNHSVEAESYRQAIENLKNPIQLQMRSRPQSTDIKQNKQNNVLKYEPINCTMLQDNTIIQKKDKQTKQMFPLNDKTNLTENLIKEFKINLNKSNNLRYLTFEEEKYNSQANKENNIPSDEAEFQDLS